MVNKRLHTIVSRAIFRDRGSRNTSNSSMTLKGVSKLSPKASSKESVTNDRSPPLLTVAKHTKKCKVKNL